MSQAKEGLFHLPTPREKAARMIGSHLAPGLFPNEVHIQQDAIGKAEYLAKMGYGLICLYTHISKDDQVRLLAPLWSRSPTLRGRVAYSPVGYHVRKESEKFAKPFGIITKSIVIQDTIDKGLNYDENGNELSEQFGVREYLQEATSVLKNGGFVFIAPQQGRRTRLEPPDKRPVGTLLLTLDQEARTSGKPIPVAFMFVGLGFKREEQYDEPEESFFGQHMGKKFLINIGPTLTREELDQAANDQRMKTDQFVFHQLGLLVPQKYNNLHGESPYFTPHSPPSQV